MLTDHNADPMLLATDLAAAKDFYTGTLGLPLVQETEYFVSFAAGNGSRIAVTASTTGTKDEATKVSFRVADVDAEVAALRERGVAIRDYPDLGTVDGIADVGFARVAWFDDPFGNSLQLTQFAQTS